MVVCSEVLVWCIDAIASDGVHLTHQSGPGCQPDLVINMLSCAMKLAFSRNLLILH